MKKTLWCVEVVNYPIRTNEYVFDTKAKAEAFCEKTTDASKEIYANMAGTISLDMRGFGDDLEKCAWCHNYVLNPRKYE